MNSNIAIEFKHKTEVSIYHGVEFTESVYFKADR